MGNKMPLAPPPVRRLWGLLNDTSPTFLVGGAARDSVIGREPKDYDLATGLKPTAIADVAAKAGLETIWTGVLFGTVTVLTPVPVEVTTFRRDGRYSDYRRPDVVSFAASLEEDLSRRDFTMNAIAISYDGQVVDRFGGAADIAAHMIRTVGNAEERFKEDPLRMLRAVRLAAVLGDEWEIADQTGAAIERLRHMTAFVSRERVSSELTKALDAPAAKAVGLLDRLGLLVIAIPEWQGVKGFDQKNPHHPHDVGTHSIMVAQGMHGTVGRLAGLLHDIAKPACMFLDQDGVGRFFGHAEVGAIMAEDILERLRFPSETIEEVTALVKHHMFPFEQAGAAGYRRLIRGIGPDLMATLVELHVSDVRAVREDLKGWQFPEEVAALLASPGLAEEALAPLAINGKDVMSALSIGPGPMVGQALRECRDAVDEEPGANTKETLLKLIRPLRASEGEWLGPESAEQDGPSKPARRLGL